MHIRACQAIMRRGKREGARCGNDLTQEDSHLAPRPLSSSNFVDLHWGGLGVFDTTSRVMSSENYLAGSARFRRGDGAAGVGDVGAVLERVWKMGFRGKAGSDGIGRT